MRRSHMLERVIGILLYLSMLSGLHADTCFVVQAGAFSKHENAEAHAALLKQLGIIPVEVRKEETGTKGIFYKVLAGSFKTRKEADQTLADIESLGIDAFVRSDNVLDLAIAREVIEGNVHNYFSTSGKFLSAVDQPPKLFPVGGSRSKNQSF